MKSIVLESLSYTYPQAEKAALSQLNLEIEEGEFVLLIGGSGSGKSTLLRVLKGLIPNFHGGKLSGDVRIEGVMANQLSQRDWASKIGLVFQNPEDQVVMSRVEDELAFGLENIGMDQLTMQRRLLEVSDALGLNELMEASTGTLSGGQLQKTAMASILVMQPRILLMDEPTSQLDPFAGEDILSLAKRLNEDNGMTIILAEQRLERCIHLADRVIYMENGKIVLNTENIQEALNYLAQNDCPAIHPLGKVFANTKMKHTQIPLTVKEGRRLLRTLGVQNQLPKDQLIKAQPPTGEKKGFFKKKSTIKEDMPSALCVKNIHFEYPERPKLLCGVNFELKPATFNVLMGENGAGKSTLFKLIAGILKPTSGKVSWDNAINKGMEMGKWRGMATATENKRIGYLSQCPNDYLFSETVAAEIQFTLTQKGLVMDERVKGLLSHLGLEPFLQCHPRDLSAGERQRVALASVMASSPDLLLLDEPTRGLDYHAKASLGKYLLELTEEGVTVLMITHDVEFAAEYAEEVLLMTKGRIIAQGKKSALLTDSIFYASQVSKLFAGFEHSAVTVKEAVEIINCLEEEKVYDSISS
jgi:energy-coupling factor transport system ATP-binding protein